MSLLLLGNLAASSPIDEEKNPQKGQPGFDGVVEEVRRDFPGAFQAGQNATVIAGRLLGAVKDRPGSAEEALARRLAAEAYLAAGREAEARALLELVRRDGPQPADRARAAFALGLRQFQAQRYAQADRYWRIVPELDPGSPAARRVERFLPYLAIHRTKEVPPFEAEFSLPGGGAVRKGRQDLQGRQAVLHFWSSAAGGAKEAAEALEKMRANSGGAGLEVLGINLDTERARFTEGVRAHGVARPEHHHGAAFESPLVRALGIPCVPHFLVIGPAGEALYLGSDLAGVQKAVQPPRKKAAKPAKVEKKG